MTARKRADVATIPFDLGSLFPSNKYRSSSQSAASLTSQPTTLNGILYHPESCYLLSYKWTKTEECTGKGTELQIPKCVPIIVQQVATLYSLFISVNCSTCFRWYLHPSSGAHTTVSRASGTCQTVTATCRIATGSSNGLTGTRCCRYSCVCS